MTTVPKGDESAVVEKSRAGQGVSSGELTGLIETLERTSIQAPNLARAEQRQSHTRDESSVEAQDRKSGGKSDPRILVTKTTRLAQSPASIKTKKDPFELIDTAAGIAKVVDKCSSLPVYPPSLFIDLEGVNLGRDGSISIIQIYIRPLKYTYLIDVFTLRKKAFTQKGACGMTLHEILEAPGIPKVIFDVRNDSDALHHHYKVKLAGVQDLQLMELATRFGRKKFVCGLKKCVELHLPMSTAELREWRDLKERGVKLFAPEHGGSYEVFNVRPLHREIVQYCVQDVDHLPKLWETFNSKLTPQWRMKVDLEVKNRIRLSQSPTFNGKTREMALGPRGWF